MDRSIENRRTIEKLRNLVNDAAPVVHIYRKITRNDFRPNEVREKYGPECHKISNKFEQDGGYSFIAQLELIENVIRHRCVNCNSYGEWPIPQNQEEEWVRTAKNAANIPEDR